MQRQDMQARRRMLLLPCAAAMGALRADCAEGSANKRVPDLSRYRLTFAAEFDDPQRSLWVRDGGPFTTRFEQWGGLRTLPATGEQQLYVDPAFVPAVAGTDPHGRADAPDGSGAPPLGVNPFRQSDDRLLISAIPVPEPLRYRVDRPYLSGLISTEWSFTQTYGYFEIRARLPAGRGLWSAFWMVSNTSAEHLEIDVFEALGHDTSTLYHSTSMPPRNRQDRGVHIRNRIPGFDYSAGLHSYGLEWTPESLVYYVDGRSFAEADGRPLRDAPPMYLIACLAVGGRWPGAPDAATHFPATLEIDYIRAYQLRR